MQDKWGWELPQLSIDTCSGWQQQIEDWRCLCEWWKTNLKTYVFWESFKITVTINNFLSCCLMKQTESSIYIHSLARKCYTFLFQSFGTSSTILLIRFSIYMLHFPKPLKRFSLATTRLLVMNWNIMVTRSNVCLSTPTFSLASEVNVRMKGNTKNMTQIENILSGRSFLDSFGLAKRVLQLEPFKFFRQKPYINKKQ